MNPPSAKASPWWTPAVHADRRPFLIGRNAIQAALRGYFAAEDFIELVVPELRKRGRYRESYDDGETLRERLFGAGQARLPEVHPGARYRDPAALFA